MPHILDQLLNGPAHYSLSHHLNPLLALAVVLPIFVAELVLVIVILISVCQLIQNTRTHLGWLLRICGVDKQNRPLVFLELIVPDVTTKSAFATEQLHLLLSRGKSYNHFWDKLAGHKQQQALELVSTGDDGIRYIMAVPENEAQYVQKNLLSFLPALKIRHVDDYLYGVRGKKVGIVELQLARDFALPLQDHKTITEHDPIGFLIGHMTKLRPDEVVAYQIVTTTVLKHTHPIVLRHVRTIQRHLALSDALIPLLFRRFPLIPRLPLLRTQHRSTTNPYEQELASSVKSKIDQSLFEVTIRLLVAGEDRKGITDRLTALVSSFQSFSATNQALRPRRDVPMLSRHTINNDLPRFQARQLSPRRLTQPTILSSSELSDMYHFPNTNLTKTEGLVKSRSQDLPLPLSLKHSATELDVVIGVNKYGGQELPVGMTLEQRQKHTYVIGKTGMGKTTLLKSSIYQDMVSGKGLAVLDPHGDMFQELLALVPEHRREDVVVFDPSDRDYPIGLNLLDPGIEFASEDDKHEWITSTVLSVFAKLTDEHQWGPRMEHILRNATMTALQVPNPSLYTLQRLLTDKKYQKDVATTLKDPVLKQFWLKEFAMLGSMQMSSAIAPLTHRLGHFITTKMSRHILLQQTTSLRVADIMNEGKILLVNLSKGDIGEDQSFFFGTILTSFIWMAAYQRTKIPEQDRRDFFVYVDEFQNFATPRFSEITSEGRKFHVSMIVSHQNIAQIEDTSILKIVAGNASTIICLKSSPTDETFILPFMKPVVVKGDITNLAPYHFFMKVTTRDSEDAFSAETVPLAATGSALTSEAVVAYSRAHYGTPRATVEAYMEDLFAGPKEPEKPTRTGAKSDGKPKHSGL